MEILMLYEQQKKEKEMVKIRPFRYGNFKKSNIKFDNVDKKLKSDRFGMEIDFSNS